MHGIVKHASGGNGILWLISLSAGSEGTRHMSPRPPEPRHGAISTPHRRGRLWYGIVMLTVLVGCHLFPWNLCYAQLPSEFSWPDGQIDFARLLHEALPRYRIDSNAVPLFFQ